MINYKQIKKVILYRKKHIIDNYTDNDDDKEYVEVIINNILRDLKPLFENRMETKDEALIVKVREIKKPL